MRIAIFRGERSFGNYSSDQFIVSLVGGALQSAPDTDAHPPTERQHFRFTYASHGLACGEIAPPFTARTLDGQTKTLADYTDCSAAFVFIAPECEPCRTLLPTLENVGPQARQSGTELVLICNGNEEQARTLLEQISTSLPILLAPGQDNPFFQDYQVHGTPSYCVLNTHGRIQAVGHPGPHDREWQKLLEAWSQQHTLSRGRS